MERGKQQSVQPTNATKRHVHRINESIDETELDLKYQMSPTEEVLIEDFLRRENGLELLGEKLDSTTILSAEQLSSRTSFTAKLYIALGKHLSNLRGQGINLINSAFPPSLLRPVAPDSNSKSPTTQISRDFKRQIKLCTLMVRHAEKKLFAVEMDFKTSFLHKRARQFRDWIDVNCKVGKEVHPRDATSAQVGDDIQWKLASIFDQIRVGSLETKDELLTSWANWTRDTMERLMRHSKGK